MIKTLQTILRQDRERFIIPKGVQEIIPVNRIWSDGIFKSGNVYTKTFKFSDINYAKGYRPACHVVPCCQRLCETSKADYRNKAERNNGFLFHLFCPFSI